MGPSQASAEVSVDEFISELVRQGVRLGLEGERLRCSAAPGILTSELVSSIRRRREAIVRQLRSSGANRNLVESPLSFTQEGLWLAHQLDPDSSAYHLPVALRLRGPFHPAVLVQALSGVTRRHDVLRTSYPVRAGRPYQRVAEAASFPVPLVDLQSLPDPEAVVRSLALTAARHPFDLANGPVIRAALLRLSPRDHLLLLTRHHIASDGWSFSLMAAELEQAYLALSQGHPPRSAALAGQYADFAAEQRASLATDTTRARIEARLGELAGITPVLAVAAAPSPDPSEPALSVRRHCPAELTQRLQGMARAAGTTVFSLLLTGFGLALGSCEGRREVILGTPASGRIHPGLEPLIGAFATMVPLRLTFPPRATFERALRETTREVARALAGQDIPIEQLTSARSGQRAALSPLPFTVAFVWQNVPPARLDLPGITVDLGKDVQVAPKFPLTVTVTPTGSGLDVLAEFPASTGIDTAEVLLERFQAILALAGLDADQSCANLQRRASSPTDQPVTREPAQDSPTLGARFEELARTLPDTIALSHDGAQLSYGALNRRAQLLARDLRIAGVGPESRVGLCAEPSADLVVGMLAVVLSGGAYVPLDPANPPLRHEQLIQDADIHVILAGAALTDTFAWHDGPVLPISGRRRGKRGTPDMTVVAEPVAENLAYVIFTSGSTGSPKGVMVSHGNVHGLLAGTSEFFGFSGSEVWALTHSSAFDFSVWEIWGALLTGARLVLMPPDAARDPGSLWERVIREQVTVLNLTPTAFRVVLDALPADSLPVSTVILGGEACEPRRFARWLERSADRPISLVNMFGITETTVHVTRRPLTSRDLAATAPASPIGTPLAGFTARVEGPDGVRAAPGGRGELVVGGAGVTRGYLKRPGQTADRYRPDDQSRRAGARVFRSGDLVARHPDGELGYLGRIDEQVQIRGFRIEPGEVEAVLSGHPALATAAVVARREGERHFLVAYVVPLEDGRDQVSVTELEGYLAQRLPAFMVPSTFLVLDRLPLTVNGKLDRNALPSPDSRANLVTAPPKTATQKRLSALWRDLLGLPSVGIHDDFFALGGDSLLVTRLHARLPAEFGVDLPMRKVYTALDIASLADAIDQIRANPHPDPDRQPDTDGNR